MIRIAQLGSAGEADRLLSDVLRHIHLYPEGVLCELLEGPRARHGDLGARAPELRILPGDARAVSREEGEVACGTVSTFRARGYGPILRPEIPAETGVAYAWLFWQLGGKVTMSVTLRAKVEEQYPRLIFRIPGSKE